MCITDLFTKYAENLQAAMDAVKSGRLSQRSAAFVHGIPKQTLFDHLQSGCTIKRRSLTLTPNQEAELVSRIMSENVRTREAIRRFVYVFCENNKIKHCFSKAARMAGARWLIDFLKRHPEISLKAKRKNR